MFLLIFYCGLISFVVSVHSNDDTLDDGDKLNISTTLSALPSTTIPVSKKCIVEMIDSQISQIVELFNSNVVNVVDIHFSFSGTSHEKHFLSDFHVSLVNPIGREIIQTLDRWLFTFFPWTLNAGIRNFELHFKENQNDCIKRGKNLHNFILENAQNIIRSINPATKYEVCFSYKETSPGKVKRTCCQITKSKSTKFIDGCSEPKSFLYGSRVPWIVIGKMMIFFAWFYLMWLLTVLLSHTEFDLKYPKYYRREESRMSPSFILFKFIWEENGRVASFIRSCVLIVGFSYCTYLFFWSLKLIILNVFMLILFLFWGLSFSISYLYRSKITDSNILLIKIKKERNRSLYGVYSFKIVQYVNELHQEVDSRAFAGVIKILTLPFNINLWRKIMKKLHSLFTIFTTCVDKRFRNRIFKNFALCTCYVLAVPICFLYVCIVFLVVIIIVITYNLDCTAYMLYLIQNLEYKIESNCSRFLSLFHVIGLLFFLFLTLNVIIRAIQSFLLGLFLNLIYFIPYFAFFSVLTFYCCSYWKTMEEKYWVLKRLIYEACRDKQQVNNGCIPNRHPKRKEKVLPVVSKELYDTIREKLLPYYTNLFYLGLKLFWSFVFSFGILKLISMLNELNVTGVVQVVTTASLGIMPHVFNMVALKINEERKKASEEKFKLNVNYMVEDLIREDPELAWTVIIQENDVRTSKKIIEDYELVQPLRCNLNPHDDDDVEDPELAPTVIGQENNDTTDEENVRNSGRVEARFELDPCDSDDQLPIVMIHSPPATETPHESPWYCLVM